MKTQYFTELKFQVNDIHPENDEIVIALLGDYPFDTFQSDDGMVSAYGPNDSFDNHLKDEIAALLQPYGEVAHWTQIEKENWNKLWEENYFEPIAIGNFYVRAPFHPPAPESKKAIEIVPKMSFGTGHHATTKTVLECMQLAKTRFDKASVLDMGTGSGILAIAAEFLGAKAIWGIEIDDWVVENALENVQINGCQKTQITEGTSDLISEEKDKYDVILANIHREVLIADLPRYAKALKETGSIFLSGIQKNDINAIDKSAGSLGLKKELEKTQDGWFVLVYVKGHN